MTGRNIQQNQIQRRQLSAMTECSEQKARREKKVGPAHKHAALEQETPDEMYMDKDDREENDGQAGRKVMQFIL